MILMLCVSALVIGCSGIFEPIRHDPYAIAACEYCLSHRETIFGDVTCDYVFNNPNVVPPLSPENKTLYLSVAGDYRISDCRDVLS